MGETMTSATQMMIASLDVALLVCHLANANFKGSMVRNAFETTIALLDTAYSTLALIIVTVRTASMTMIVLKVHLVLGVRKELLKTKFFNRKEENACKIKAALFGIGKNAPNSVRGFNK